MSKYCTENIKSMKHIHDYYLINWHVTGWCNFHCPYCINQSLATSWISEEIKIKEAKKINELINKSAILKDKKIAFRLIGGEPAFYDWPKILDNIDRIDKVGMISNFSNKLDYYKNLYKYFKSRNIKFFLGITKHAEHPNFEEKAIEFIKWCDEEKFDQPQIVLIAGPDFNESEYYFYKDKGAKRIRVSLLRDVNQNTNWCPDDLRKTAVEFNKDYAVNRGKFRDYRLEFLDGTTEDFCAASDMTNLIEGGFIPDGFYCTAGTTVLGILPDSTIVKNKCRYLNALKIGNLLTDDIDLPTKPIICRLNENDSENKLRCSLCTGVNISRDEKDI